MQRLRAQACLAESIEDSFHHPSPERRPQKCVAPARCDALLITQRPIPLPSSNDILFQVTPYSIYLHIPFCAHRCGYCDFNTYAGLDELIPAYVEALCAEIVYAASAAGQRLPVHTVFFGGGTPSRLSAGQVERILGALQGAFDWQAEVEVTLEANPGSLSLGYLSELRRLGVNRLSLGVQSAHPAELRLLERQHDYFDVIRSVARARQAGFENLNLDLIFGLPEQQLSTWQRTLELALGLRPEHFSLYALSLEHGTPFGRWAAHGLLSTPDPDLAADMYEWASARLEKDGYTQYEISNWATDRPLRPAHSPAGEAPGGATSGAASPLQPKYACRHNLQYWRGLPYLGFGAGAHGYAAGVRTANVLSPAGYIQRFANSDQRSAISGQRSAVSDQRSAISHRRPIIRNPQSKIPNSQSFPQTPATQTAIPVDRRAEMGETMMMGLRLVQEGVSNRAFEERFGQTLEQVYARQIERLAGLGLLEWAGEDGDRLRLTRRGRLLGNQVFVDFI